MNSDFYLPRQLYSNDKNYTEAELLATFKFIVVLAEPGAGKSELMKSFARQLEATVVTARKFSSVGADKKDSVLIIDAFDELAILNPIGIDNILRHAKDSNPTHVIISSRASEWSQANILLFNDFFNESIIEIRLFGFNRDEQCAIFEHILPDERFSLFESEVAKFNLDILLPNPQFLKLFAAAYIESGKHFTDKYSIFSLAIEHLAKESNINVVRTNSTLSFLKKIELSSEVFAKILLSGSEGVSSNEAIESRTYPLLSSLFNNQDEYYDILTTRLFKPSDTTGLYLPVHRIIAEYCAAKYLCQRIKDPADPLSLQQCLSLIAPSSIVRTELRGLIGWMAALGSRYIQESIIELDPYAVLANGDPSQLIPTSKRHLIYQLKRIANEDPYFRKGDFWRRRSFSVTNFFTQDAVAEIKLILHADKNSQLRNLILELLKGSAVIELLVDELHQILLSPNESEDSRLLAGKCLVEIKNYNPHASLVTLISEGSYTSLMLVTEIIKKVGSESVKKIITLDFFRVFAKLYPDREDGYTERTSGKRYFIKYFIPQLTLDIIEYLLDELSNDLVCHCDKSKYECNCLNGTSKVIGTLLDHYFELVSPPYDAIKIWQWVTNLSFHHGYGFDPKDSESVQTLRNDKALRQNIITHVFGSLTDRQQILKIRTDKFSLHQKSHAGLEFTETDYQFIINLAFDTNNIDLWASFITRHKYFSKKK